MGELSPLGRTCAASCSHFGVDAPKATDRYLRSRALSRVNADRLNGLRHNKFCAAYGLGRCEIGRAEPPPVVSKGPSARGHLNINTSTYWRVQIRFASASRIYVDDDPRYSGSIQAASV
ncbi:unnamed protein product, partial [Iphiclides podalirius]